MTIFCLFFQKTLISGGNDRNVIAHDVKTGQALDMFPHDEPVYCISTHPECTELFTTACSDGRVQLFDLRASNVSNKIFLIIRLFSSMPLRVILLSRCPCRGKSDF